LEKNHTMKAIRWYDPNKAYSLGYA